MAKDKPPPGEKRRHELGCLEVGEVERARVWAEGPARAAGPMAASGTFEQARAVQ